MLMMSKYYKTASLCSYHMHVALSDSQKKLQVGLQLFQLSRKRDLTLARSHHFKREKSSFVKRVPQNIDEIGYDDSLSKNKQEAKRTDILKKENIFEDYRLAYRTKSTWELSRALGIFLICRFPSFADNALRVRFIHFQSKTKFLKKLSPRLKRGVFNDIIFKRNLKLFAWTVAYH